MDDVKRTQLLNAEIQRLLTGFVKHLANIGAIEGEIVQMINQKLAKTYICTSELVSFEKFVYQNVLRRSFIISAQVF